MPDPRFSRPTPVAVDPVGALVGEFVREKRKEQQEEKSRHAARKRSPLLVPLFAAVCLAIWMAPSMMPPREEPLTQETLEHGARLTLYLASLRVRQYLDTHKRLPTSLSQVGVDTIGIVYSRSTDSFFELSMRVQGARLVYKSALPDSTFLGPNLRIKGIS